MAGAWAIHGVDVPAAVARTVAYSAAGGQAGVIEAGGMKVEPLAVPGASVRVMPGAVNILNKYPGGAHQMYAFASTQATSLPIQATGSSGGRRDVVFARIYDPEYQTVPAGVTAGAEFWVEQGANQSWTAENYRDFYHNQASFPAEPLAIVDLPANTATVTAGMITDIRELSNPRRTATYWHGLASGGDLVSSSFVHFPNAAPTIRVPAWATHCHVFSTVQLYAITSGVAAERRLCLGPKTSPVYEWDTSMGISASDPDHATIFTSGWWDVRDIAGTSQVLKLEMRRVRGSGSLRADGRGPIGFNIDFYQQAV